MSKDRDKILDRLQVALRDEHLTVFCYLVQADEVESSGHFRLANRLRTIGAHHRRHIEWVEERILELGGHPRSFVPPPDLATRMRCLPAHDLCTALEHDLKAEDTEIESYQTLAGQSDCNTAEMCEQATSEDREHVEWLRIQLISGLRLEGGNAEGEPE